MKILVLGTTIFLSANDVINIVYHVENQQLTRFGDYYQFLDYEAKEIT